MVSFVKSMTFSAAFGVLLHGVGLLSLCAAANSRHSRGHDDGGSKISEEEFGSVSSRRPSSIGTPVPSSALFDTPPVTHIPTVTQVLASSPSDTTASWPTVEIPSVTTVVVVSSELPSKSTFSNYMNIVGRFGPNNKEAENDEEQVQAHRSAIVSVKSMMMMMGLVAGGVVAMVVGIIGMKYKQHTQNSQWLVSSRTEPLMYPDEAPAIEFQQKNTMVMSFSSSLS